MLGILASAFIVTLLEYFAVSDTISQIAPFSANFMMSHPMELLLIFVSLMIIGRTLKWLFVGKKVNFQAVVFVFIYISGFACAFTASDPYHILNWIIFTIPVLGFAIYGRPAWLVIFLCLWNGLAIRRLTYLNAYVQIELPERWLLAALMLVLAICLRWFHLRRNPEKTRSILLMVFSFIPCLLVIAWPISVEWKAFLMLGLLPVYRIISREHAEWDLWIALWVTFFYLGTSSRLSQFKCLSVPITGRSRGLP